MSGCAASSWRLLPVAPTTPVPAVAPIVQFADVPVPPTFAFIKEESFRFEHEALRVGLLKYLGRESMEEVALFYRERMPQGGWFVVNELAHDRHILSFEKPDATCTVTIENQGVDTRLSVAIAPRHQEESKDKRLDKN